MHLVLAQILKEYQLSDTGACLSLQINQPVIVSVAVILKLTAPFTVYVNVNAILFSRRHDGAEINVSVLF